jgi:hypothetical protein
MLCSQIYELQLTECMAGDVSLTTPSADTVIGSASVLCMALMRMHVLGTHVLELALAGDFHIRAMSP